MAGMQRSASAYAAFYKERYERQAGNVQRRVTAGGRSDGGRTATARALCSNWKRCRQPSHDEKPGIALRTLF